MSRDYRPYPPTSSRPHRAESWQPDRPHRSGRTERSEYGDLGDYGDHEGRYDYDAPRARRYAGAYAGRSDHPGDHEPRYGNRYATAEHSRYEAVDYPTDDGDHFEDRFDEDDDEIYEYYEPMDRRWVWVAGVAAATLLIAVICTVVILGGSDSGSVSATVNPPAATGQPVEPRTSTAPPPATTSPPPVASLPAETVTTIAPTPTATAAPPPPVAAAPVPAAPGPNTVTYTVSGTRSLIDLVTVIYTDAQGALQTDLNVALPWRKTVVLDPGVTLSSVTATSVTGQLNCSITDSSGNAIAAQNGNTIITTCTR